MIKCFKAEEAKIRKISDSYSVANLLTVENSEKLSVAVSEAVEHNETTQTSSDRAYYILEWELVINDELKAKKWDLIFIPGNREYNFKWTFKAVLINSPAFKKEEEKIKNLKK